MLGVMASGQSLVDRQHANLREPKTLALEAPDDVPDQPPSNPVRFHHDEGGFVHGRDGRRKTEDEVETRGPR